MATKILLVDDSKTIRMILTKALSSFDCQIFEAGNGEEAIAVATKERPELIIMDVTMPVMDGAQALAKLKETAELKDIPVVMLTANVEWDDKIKILRMGASEYMTKSFKPDELIACVKRFVDLAAKA